MRKIILTVVALCAFGMTGCDKEELQPKTECSRVFMHQPGVFSVLDNDFNSVNFFNANGVVFRIVPDVPADKPMWFQGIKAGRDWKSVEIHIHSVHDINGAGWSGNKGTAPGTTTVIE